MCMTLPIIKLDVSSGPDDALELMLGKNFDIVVCDAFLLGEARTEFVNKVCNSEPKALLLVVTDDTQINRLELFSKFCVHEILYKPINLAEFLNKMKGMLSIVNSRKKNNVT